MIAPAPDSAEDERLAPEMSDAAGDIRERIVRIYTALAPGGRTPADDEPGELDSMAFLEFIMGIEREFAIEVDVSELDESNFASTSATTAYIQRKLNGARP